MLFFFFKKTNLRETVRDARGAATTSFLDFTRRGRSELLTLLAIMATSPTEVRRERVYILHHIHLYT